MFALVLIFILPSVSSAFATSTNFSISNIVYQSAITSNGANVGYAASATSDGNAVTASCSPSSGSVFPVGTTVVTCSYTANQITSSASFIITVSGNDSTPPNITPPPSAFAYQTQGQTNPLTYVNLGSPIVTDNIDLSPVATNNYPDSMFPLGTSTVTWMAFDHSGNSNSATQTVNVYPYVAPNVSASPPGGFYKNIQFVTLSSTNSNVIYYTIDGTNPTTSSAIYNAPIKVSSNMVIKFFENTNQTPNIVTESYTIDASPPVIAIVGSNPAIVLQGSTYSDAGATANDNIDGNISSLVVSTSNVNTSTSGTYTVTYNVSDKSGNSAAQVSRTVVVTTGNVVTYMSDTTSSTGQSIYSGRPIHSEFASPTSQLIGDSIDTITLKLKKSGFPTGQAEIGVFNPDLSAKKLFASVDVSTFTTNYVDYTYSLPSGQSYTIQANDRIGVKYVGGDSNTNISIMRDTDTADPFDGVNSYHSYYTTVWNSATTTDLYMILIGNGASSSGDTIPPVITLQGSNPVTVQQDSAYSDSGATAKDNIDGNITQLIVTSNPINTSILGTYYVTYNVRDSSGNAAIQITRTVNVVDNTSPTVTPSPQEGLYNSPQNVTLTASSPSIIYYTTNGNTPTTSSPVYNSPIPVGSSQVLKFFAKTLTGNSGPVSSVTYTIDTIAPVITINGSIFVTVNVFSSYSDAGASATDNLDGNISSSIITTSNVNTSVLGTYHLTYNVHDSAGNSATATRTVSVVDQTPPVITILGANPATVNLGATYVDSGATALDNYDGDLTSSIIPTSNVNTSVAGTYAVRYNVMDSSLNQTPEVIRYVNVIDSTPPVTTAFPAGGTYSSTQLVMLTTNKPAAIYYTIDGTTPTTSSSIYSSYITIAQNTTLKFFAVDAGGNTESVKTEVYTIEISYPLIHMSDTTSSSGQTIYTSKPLQAEYVSGQSQLVGDKIQTIAVKLKKSGTPSSSAQIGVFNTDLSIKKLFATLDTSTLTTDYVEYAFTLSAGDSYTIQSGDRIGVKYASGDAKNNISIMRDTDSADPFDGVNSYLTYYQNQWKNTATSDLYMKLIQTGP